MIYVHEAEDDRLDDFRDLTTADRRPDRPGGRGLVIAEGTVVVRRLLASPYRPLAVLGVRRRVEELADDLAGHPIPTYVTSAEVMARVVGFHLNRGVLAIADRVASPTVESIVGEARVLAVLEGIGDHENLGSLFRNAAALGVDGVLLGPGCADPLYRRSVRVSMGNVLRVPFTNLPDWPGALTWLRERGFAVVALTPRPDAVELRRLRQRVPGRVAVLLGSEGHGLSERAIETAGLAARIPMAPGVDSLNVATAAAVAFYELASADGSETFEVSGASPEEAN